MSWDSLSCGSIVYGTSTSALRKGNGKFKKGQNFEQEHFIVILTDEVFNKVRGTKTDFHLGVALSKKQHGEGDISISSDILPREIQKHFGARMQSSCYLVITKPVIVQKNRISTFCESHVDEFCPDFGLAFCNYLCESRELLSETLFRNMSDYNLPNIESLSGSCSCNDCGCLNPYQAKILQGETTLSICPNHIDEMQDYVADFDIVKQNIECYNQMKLIYARMENGDFREGENEYTMVRLKASIEDCKQLIESEGAYCNDFIVE